MNANSPRIQWSSILVAAVLVAAGGLVTLLAEEPPGGAALKSLDAAGVQARAERGDAAAQVELGLRYTDGSGVRMDYSRAAEWFRKAALQGNADGQLELGVMHVNGEGMETNPREGYAWYVLSAGQGNEIAKGYMRDLDGTMPAAEREAARRRATEIARQIEEQRAPATARAQHRSPASKADTADPAATSKPVTASPPGKPGGGKFVEGKDYTVWHRVRFMDENGFGQPAEAYSLLLPKDWTTKGGVRWVINANCPSDAVQNRATATSPDNEFRLEIFPQSNWQWFDDPMMMRNAMANAQSGFGGCPIARPFDAAGYLQQVFVPTEFRGVAMTSHRPNEQMSALMKEKARQNNAAYQSAQVNLDSRPSAEIGRLQWPDGRIGIVLCAVEQTVAMMPNLLNGGNFASYQCRATVKIMLSGPAGSEQQCERLLGTITSSSRINPEWQAAVQQVYSNIAKVEQRETAKRAAIWRQSQQEIGEIHRRSWEDSQASRDRIAESWGQVMRGVETWREPGGGQIELSAGYRDAWSKPDGTYILSNDPLFDPSVVFQENWKKLEKKQ